MSLTERQQRDNRQTTERQQYIRELGMIDNGALISLSGIKKVFYTDEVETHALAGIHLEIKRGEYIHRVS